MKQLFCLLILAVALVLPCKAEYLDTNELERNLTPDAREILSDVSPQTAGTGGVKNLLRSAGDGFRTQLRAAFSSAFLMTAACAVISLAAAFAKQSGHELPQKLTEITSVVAILAIGISNAGSLIGECGRAMEGYSAFSKTLIPVFAAATALSGRPVAAAGTATVTLTAGALLIDLASRLILPAIYASIVLTAAGLIAENSFLCRAASLIKWLTTGFYKLFLIGFTLMLSISGIAGGSADVAAVKTARVTLSGVVPVVGSVVADASEAIVGGAGVLRTSIGIYGMLGACAICLVPFVALFTYFLVFKLMSAVATSFATAGAAKMIDGISDGYAVSVGLLGTCCALQFLSFVVSTVVIRL